MLLVSLLRQPIAGQLPDDHRGIGKGKQPRDGHGAQQARDEFLPGKSTRPIQATRVSVFVNWKKVSAMGSSGLVWVLMKGWADRV